MRVKPKGARVVFLSSRGRPKLRSKAHSPFTTFERSEMMENGIDAAYLGSDDEMGDSRSPSVTIDPAFPPIPTLYTSRPPIKDTFSTPTTEAQDHVIKQCLPLLTGKGQDPSKVNHMGTPHLDRRKHITFLDENIGHARFQFLDASRPWLVYWCLTGLSILGEDVEVYRDRYLQMFVDIL